VADPTHINPELGSLEDFERLVREIRRTIWDFYGYIPNHMAISSRNPFWMELLETSSSPWANFSISIGILRRKEVKNKIILRDWANLTARRWKKAKYIYYLGRAALHRLL